MSGSGLELPGLIQSPLVRADVTRLELLDHSPREQRRPLRRYPLPVENRREAGCPRVRVDALGEDIRELLRRRDPKQTEVSELDGLVRKVLANVDVLSTFTSPDDVVAPLDARGVVFIQRSRTLTRESKRTNGVTKPYPFCRRSRC